MSDIKINSETLDKCNFAYTVFCGFLDDERESLPKDELDSFKARFLFDLLYSSSQKLESDYLIEDLQGYLA